MNEKSVNTVAETSREGTPVVQKQNQLVSSLYFILCSLAGGSAIMLGILGPYCLSTIKTGSSISPHLLGSAISAIVGLACMIGALSCFVSGLNTLDDLRKNKKSEFPWSDLKKPVWCLFSCMAAALLVTFTACWG